MQAVAVPISGTMHYPATPRWITQKPAAARFAGFFVVVEFCLSRSKPLESALHFHDARAEAIWRLSKKLDVLELARVVGHRDPRSLMLYYNADADSLADKLG